MVGIRSYDNVRRVLVSLNSYLELRAMRRLEVCMLSRASL